MGHSNVPFVLQVCPLMRIRHTAFVRMDCFGNGLLKQMERACLALLTPSKIMSLLLVILVHKDQYLQQVQQYAPVRQENIGTDRTASNAPLK